MTDQQYDKEFEAFLAGESDLTECYTELGREEPPAELDAQILAEARNAAKVRRLKFGPRGGWLKPVALAATVLLSLSLVMNIVVDTPVRFEQVATESMPAPARLDAEKTIKNQQAQELKPRVAEQSSMKAVEEITVTARKRTVNEPDAQDEIMMDMLASESVSASTPEAIVKIIDLDTALLIVAEYVAAADSDRIEADAMTSRFTDMEKRTESAAADQVMLAAGESQSEDGAEDKPESLLRDIERLHASGASAEAGVLLDEFLQRYPGHPVSVKIRQQDY
jgi:hypothetical protein